MTTLLLILKKFRMQVFFSSRRKHTFSLKISNLPKHIYLPEVSFTKINIKSGLTTILIQLMSLWSNRTVFVCVCVLTRVHVCACSGTVLLCSCGLTCTLDFSWLGLPHAELTDLLYYIQQPTISTNNFLCSDKKQICVDDWQVLSCLGTGESDGLICLIFIYIPSPRSL